MRRLALKIILLPLHDLWPCCYFLSTSLSSPYLGYNFDIMWPLTSMFSKKTPRRPKKGGVQRTQSLSVDWFRVGLMHRLLTSWRGVRGHKNSWCPLLVQTELTPLSQTCHQHSHLSENQLLSSQAGVRTVGGSWRTHTGRSASTLRFTSNCKKSFCRASALADHFIR